MTDLLSLSEADRLIGASLPLFADETVPLAGAAARILRQDVLAERALPPYDRVIMDGIAVRWTGQHRHFLTAGLQGAGQPPLTLPEDGACIRVMTGSVLPLGADTVIPREKLVEEERDRQGRHAFRLETDYAPSPGQHVHRQGADCRAGERLLGAGCILTPPAMAILAANNVAHPRVTRVPAIAIVSTGDELVSPGAPVENWQIRRSNEFAIGASLARKGFVRQTQSILRDDLAQQVETLGALLASHDVLILSGGVSMGEFDYIPRALERLGVRKVFHKVAQRPGKPFWFGIAQDGRPVFALPGNPVSAASCCSRHVIPALLRAQGAEAAPIRMVRLGQALDPIRDMTRFVPVRLTQDDGGMTTAIPFPMPSSGDFNRLALTDGIVELPPGGATREAGCAVAFHDW
ncbi:molybdopterin molybdotransferase MoeA [Swaminathania salitolerans]|uniref:Molybdopterin molybdenumtransferase n=1 Tax=Swaminathania salitolerans TaxID=182838 RepID=A0A511BKV1_9PROT|nr:molybdopterin molybdotransferase MoeA [Swaminathania salitolerans]GBQ09443.1 molybdopterin biosynthesis protein MoeA [Swaminathania salitolerans LMG 21291]GEL00971.1 molybdopterin molybdenumtransferase MoeA [Swaminathania salitolerans]